MDSANLFAASLKDDSPAATVKRTDFVAGWLKALDESREREKGFRKTGANLVKLFEAEEAQASPYNILYSNTDTLLPALYNAQPRPKVTGRFQKKQDALQRLAAHTSERILQYLMDTNAADYGTFDSMMRQTVLEALVPGRGVPRVKYDATFGPGEPIGGLPRGEDTDDPTNAPPAEVVSYETVCFETVPWDRFLHGYGKKWHQVPWVSFEHQMTREELRREFPETGELVKVEDFSETDSPNTGGNSLFGSRTKESAGAKLATVYEIWDKVTRTVVFISPGAPDLVLKEVDDPLKLSGFFPTPEPLSMVPKISGLCPVALYKLYEQQAEELNDITIRITKLTRALRLRGYYDSTLEGLEKVLKADDNTLVAISNAAQLTSQGIGMEKAIWLFPLEAVVGALQQLYSQRVQVKSVIFEITGIADIMRGSSQASETLGAQELKNQWGTLRLKKAQKEVARLARDTLRLALEVAVGQLSPETIRGITGLPFPTGAEKAQAQAQLQQMQAQAQMMPPGTVPPPDPQLVAVAQSPSWDDILGLLQNDELRQFNIDIETNSTVDAEATDDKKDMAELMNAMAQFLNGVTPLVTQGALPFDAAKAILQNLLRRFRMGGDVEEALMSMQQPQQQGADPKAVEELQKAQQKLVQDQQAFAQEVEKEKLRIAESEAALAMQAKELELEKQFAQRELAMQHSFNERLLDLQQREAQGQLTMAAEGQKQKLSAAATRAAMSLNAKAQQGREGGR